MTRDAVKDGDWYVCFIDDGEIQVEGRAQDPQVAVKIAEKNLQVAKDKMSLHILDDGPDY